MGVDAECLTRAFFPVQSTLAVRSNTSDGFSSLDRLFIRGAGSAAPIP